MPKASLRRLSWKFFALTLMLGCLVFLSASREAAADENCCITQYNTCNSGCSCTYDPATGICHTDIPCETNCQQQYATCTQTGGTGCPPQQPKTPCEECLDNCDSMYDSCLASGSQTPQQCAFLRYRCKQRCNTACIY